MTVQSAFSLIACSVTTLLLVHGAGAENSTRPPLPTSVQPVSLAANSLASAEAPTRVAAQPPEPTVLSFQRVSRRHAFQIEMNENCAAQFRESDYCEGPARLRILSRATQKETQTIELANLITVRGADDVRAVQPSDAEDYDASLVLEDFNFDGQEDLAVQTGTNGAYGGPTYQVFLFQKPTGKFTFATELSDLTEGYLGLFDVDPVRKRITTYSKGGCCYHESREYEFVGIRPVLVARFTEDATANDGYVLETSEQLVRGRWVKRVTRTKASDAGEDW